MGTTQRWWRQRVSNLKRMLNSIHNIFFVCHHRSAVLASSYCCKYTPSGRSSPQVLIAQRHTRRLGFSPHHHRLLLHSASFSILLPPPSSPLRYSKSPWLSRCIFKLFPSPIQSLPHTLPFFPFEVWQSGDEKQLLVWSPPLPPLSLLRSVHHLSIWLHFSFLLCRCRPSSPLHPLYIEGRESEIGRRSKELFKQNANGLLMDPHFFPPIFFFFSWLCLVTGWLAGRQSAV